MIYILLYIHKHTHTHTHARHSSLDNLASHLCFIENKEIIELVNLESGVKDPKITWPKMKEKDGSGLVTSLLVGRQF